MDQASRFNRNQDTKRRPKSWHREPVITEAPFVKRPRNVPAWCPSGRPERVQMTDIHGIQPPIAPRPVEPTSQIQAGNEKVQPAGISDVVEISDIAKLAAKIQELPEVRTELVQQVRDELAAGSYETPEKLEIAIDRLMEEFLG